MNMRFSSPICWKKVWSGSDLVSSSVLMRFHARKNNQLRNYRFSSLAAIVDPPDDDFFDSKRQTKDKSTENIYFLPVEYRSPKKQEQYTLGNELGRGMFATVYEAVCSRTGRHVAVKVMDKRTTPKDLCERELRILEHVSENKVHSRINTIFDVYETDDDLCIVLELMAGDLFEHMAASGRLSEPEAASVTRKLCYTLRALHHAGILHRDIKLENLLIGKSNANRLSQPDGTSPGLALDVGYGSRTADHFKLADFGFAKRIDETDRFHNPAGTLGYAAPEVLQRREYGTACDVWSAGVVLYIMLAGHPPFPTKKVVDPTTMSIEEQLELELEAIYYGRDVTRWTDHLEKEPWKDVSLPAKILVSKMLRLDPDKRYTTAQVLKDPWILMNTYTRHYEYLNFE